MKDKAFYRNKAKTAAALMTNAKKRQKSEVIGNTLLSNSYYKNAERIYIYISTENEPDTSGIIRQAQKDGKKVYVPLCLQKGRMVGVKLSEKSEFTLNKYGIKEPVTDENSEIHESAEYFDLCIMPCLAVSVKGDRLGHGGGYYDRFLKAEQTRPVKVCLCFKDLIFDDIPTDCHDIKPDIIITD